jgi:MFS family permease
LLEADRRSLELVFLFTGGSALEPSCLVMTSATDPPDRRPAAGPWQHRRIDGSSLRRPEGIVVARRATSVVFLVHGAMVGTWAARVADVQRDLGLSERALGFALVGFAAGSVLALPVAGGLSARHGPRAAVGLGWVSAVAGLVLAGVAGSALGLAVVLAVFGTGLSLTDVGMNAHGAVVERRLDRRVMIGFHARWSIGGVLGALGGAGAIALGWTPLTHFAVAAGVGAVVVAVVLSSFLPAGPRPEVAPPRLALPTRALAGLALMGAGAALAEGAATDWAAVHLRQVFDVSGSGAALGYLLFAAGMTATRLVGDRYVERRGAGGVTRAVAAIAAAGFVLVAAAPVAPLAVVGFGLAGIGLGMLVPVAFSAAERVPGVAPGQGVAAVATVAYAAFVAGPPVIGLIAEAVSLRWSFAVVAACLVVVSVRPPRVA